MTSADIFEMGCAMMRAQNAAIDSDKHARALRRLIEQIEHTLLHHPTIWGGLLYADLRAALAEARRAVDA